MDINTIPPIIKSDRPYLGKRISLRRDWVDCGEEALVLREVIEHPGAVVILPITSEQKIVLVKQYRHPLGLVLFECPAGTREINENTLETAQRELAEEAKFSAQEWISLGILHPIPGLSNEVQEVYLARNLSTRNIPSDPGEYLEVHIFTFPEVKEMIKSGAITDTKSISAIYRAELNGYLGA